MAKRIKLFSKLENKEQKFVVRQIRSGELKIININPEMDVKRAVIINNDEDELLIILDKTMMSKEEDDDC